VKATVCLRTCITFYVEFSLKVLKWVYSTWNTLTAVKVTVLAIYKMLNVTVYAVNWRRHCKKGCSYYIWGHCPWRILRNGLRHAMQNQPHWILSFKNSNSYAYMYIIPIKIWYQKGVNIVDCITHALRTFVAELDFHGQCIIFSQITVQGC